MIFIRLVFLFVCVYAKPKPFQKIDNGILWQGDMLMRQETLDIALKGGDVDYEEEEEKQTGPIRISPAAAGLTASKWKDGVVPYVINGNAKCLPIIGCFTSLGRPEKVIKSAMKEWSAKTCIRFVKRTNQRDYIEFIADGFGQCYSYVGRIIGRQVLSLSNGCSSHGIALHEIGHALGLHHEQSRPDRDDYVEIKYDNIQSGFKDNFKKYGFSKVNGLGSPYDYGSIMHYPGGAFGKWPWSTTIKPKRSGVKIGQRNHLSYWDAKTINKFYNCPKK